MNEDIWEVIALHEGLTLSLIVRLNAWRAAYGEAKKDRQVARTHNWKPAIWRLQGGESERV